MMGCGMQGMMGHGMQGMMGQGMGPGDDDGLWPDDGGSARLSQSRARYHRSADRRLERLRQRRPGAGATTMQSMHATMMQAMQTGSAVERMQAHTAGDAEHGREYESAPAGHPGTLQGAE